MTDGPAVEISGLTKRYGGRAVLDELSFEVAAGTVFALLGANGAGKTTTVETIEGYRRPDAGSVRVLGLDPASDGAALRARIGLMLQDGGIYPQATPTELARLFARFYRDPADPDELIERVGLLDVADRRYRTLSGGEKQRLALALALIGRPELVVLDEPTAGMDPQAKAATRDLIADLRDDGVTVLLTTHDLADVERLADRVALIDRGRLVAQGMPAEFGADRVAASRLTFRLARALDPDELDDLGQRVAAGAKLGDDGAGAYRLEGVAPSPARIADLAAWCARHDIVILELKTGGGSLEERYLALVGAEASTEG